MTAQWQYVDLTETTVFMQNADGSRASLSVSDPIIVAYLANGNTILDIPLEQAINEKLNLVTAYRTNIVDNGMIWEGNSYDTDDVSRVNIIAAITTVTAGATLPSNFTWRSADNDNIPFTAPEFVTFGLTMFAWAEAAYVNSWTHKANIEACTTVEQVIAYDITTGWPQNGD